MASAAARSVLKVIDDEGLQAHALGCGERLLTGLRKLQSRHALIGDVRGAGLMLGIEMVRDRVTREPTVDEGERVMARMRDAGFIMVKGVLPAIPFGSTRRCASRRTTLMPCWTRLTGHWPPNKPARNHGLLD